MADAAAAGAGSSGTAAASAGTPVPGAPIQPRPQLASASSGSVALCRRPRAGAGSASASSSSAACGLDEPVPERFRAAARLRSWPPDASSGSERVARAWRAGLVAGQALASGGALSERTTDCGASNRVYSILRGTRSGRAERHASFRGYSGALGGQISGGDRISHRWPSLLEAKVYCAGAGVALPLPTRDL